MKKFLIVAVAALVTAANLQAQSADALLDKLVEKGILTVKEANDLKQQADADFTKAYSAKSGMPEWVQSMKFNGDFRGRYEQHQSDNVAHSDRDRFRYRIRFGVTASLVDDFEIGLRLSSGNPNGAFGGNPVSANTDLSDGASRKFIWVDAAYAKWTPIHTGDWNVSATIGKMDNPFALSTMIFDPDYQLEGAAINAVFNLNDQHSLKFNGGGFVLDEFNQGASASRDPYLIGAQLMWDAKWSSKIESSLYGATFLVGNKLNLLNGSAPNVNDGNTRLAAGSPLYNFTPIIGGGSFTYKLDSFPLYKDAFPIKLGGEYLYNPGAPMDNRGWWVGATLGKAGHKGLWEISWKYQRLEADAWYEELPDDDFGAYYQAGLPNSGNGAGYRGGTNVRGHVVKFVYNFTDAMNLAVTYYLTDLIHPSPVGSVSASGHWMLDLMWKF
ncbi:MAG: putative porin [Verrucomicrobia bacterium]|nr:putative porin [Verrucomicrobiota bacterium]